MLELPRALHRRNNIHSRGRDLPRRTRTTPRQQRGRLCRKHAALCVLLVLPLLGSACAARRVVMPGQTALLVTPQSTQETETPAASGDMAQGVSSAAGAFAQGQQAFQAQQYEHAVRWLEQAIQLDTTQAEYYLWLGRAYGYQAQQAAPGEQFFLARKVQKAFEKAVDMNPELLAARLDLLAFYLQAPSLVGGSVEKAKAQAVEIIKRDAQQGRLAWQQCQRANREKDGPPPKARHQSAFQRLPSAVHDDAPTLAPLFLLGRVLTQPGPNL
jgi:tetratricopeptide (TPR) repeat protein